MEYQITPNKHRAIIFGRIVKVTYYTSKYYYDTDVQKSYETLDSKVVIFDGDIDNPPLEENELIYIKDLNVTLKITGKARNLEGGYAYSTGYIVEEIEDEESEKSKVKAEEELVSHLKKVEENNRIKSEEEKRNNKWYRKLFKKSK